MSESPDEDTNAPPLKKARYHWQVKNPKVRSTIECQNISNGVSDENGNCSQSFENSGDHDINEIPNDDDGVDIESEGETQVESNNNESTELKILDKVRKFVNGQTRQIVETALSQTSLDPTENQDFSEPVCNSSVNLDEQNIQIAGPSNQTGALNSSSAVDSSNHTTPDNNANISDLEAEDEATSSTSQQNAPRLDYVTRWQSQQKAKAIVDNAINMTLEEMGLTPDLDHNIPILDRLHVEDESISEAIRRRGLYPQDNQDDGDVLQGTITPLLQQLTQVSDRVFADRLNNMRLFITIRQTARNPEDGTEAPLEWTDELAIRTLQSNSQEGAGARNNLTEQNPIPNQAFQLTLNSNHMPNDLDVNESTVESSDNDFESDVDNYYDQSDTLGESVLEESNSNMSEIPDLSMTEANNVNRNDVNTHDVNTTETSDNHVVNNNCVDSNTSDDHIDDSDLMNYAMNAAISAKGLAVQK